MRAHKSLRGGGRDRGPVGRGRFRADLRDGNVKNKCSDRVTFVVSRSSQNRLLAQDGDGSPATLLWDNSRRKVDTRRAKRARNIAKLDGLRSEILVIDRAWDV